MNLTTMVGARRSSIGLDFDDHEFRGVQLQRERDGVRVTAWAIFPRLHRGDDASERFGMPGSEEMRWAASILSRRGFRGAAVTCTPRTSDCTQHVFELPPPESGAPLEMLARGEIARARRCAPNDFEMGFWPLPQRGRSSDTMAVACPKRVIDAMIDSFDGAGFELVGIDLSEIAIVRGAFEQLSCSVDGGEAMIDSVLHVGWERSLAIVTLGERIVYVRRVGRGAREVWEHATGRYGLSRGSARAVLGDFEIDCEDAQLEKIRMGCWNSLCKEIASELDVAVAYVSHSFRTAPLGRIVTCGYGSENESLRANLDATLGVPIVSASAEPLRRAIPEDAPGSLPARLACAYGLAGRFDA